MKRSSSVYIPLLLAISGCSRERPAVDPCDKENFSEEHCRDAIAHGGYFYKGVWRSHPYSQPYTYYDSQARSFVSGGGTLRPDPDEVYSPSYSRGVFGSTGEGSGEAGSESGGHGGGEGGE